MSMSNKERRVLLSQLAEGKISANEVADLLNSSQEEPIKDEPARTSGSEATLEVTKKDIIELEDNKASADRPTWVHVRVSDLKSGKNRVTVNIPLRLIGIGLNIGSRFAPELEDLDWSSIKNSLSEETGILVDVKDEEDGEHVLIYVD
jgi:hypothetical protein